MIEGAEEVVGSEGVPEGVIEEGVGVGTEGGEVLLQEADMMIMLQETVTAAEMEVVDMVGLQEDMVVVVPSDHTIEVDHPLDVEAAEIMGANHHTVAAAVATVAKIVEAVITVAERTTGATEEGAMPTIPQDTKHHNQRYSLNNKLLLVRMNIHA
jgi:hypothetical protein